MFFGPGRHGPGNNLFFMVVDADRNRLEFSAELEITEASPPAWRLAAGGIHPQRLGTRLDPKLEYAQPKGSALTTLNRRGYLPLR